MTVVECKKCGYRYVYHCADCLKSEDKKITLTEIIAELERAKYARPFRDILSQHAIDCCKEIVKAKMEGEK